MKICQIPKTRYLGPMLKPWNGDLEPFADTCKTAVAALPVGILEIPANIACCNDYIARNTRADSQQSTNDCVYFFYLENGWMTDAQALDVLRDIQNKVPMMKKLMALTTTLDLTIGQFQWLLQNPGAILQFDQFASTNQNIPQADRNRLLQTLLGA